MATHLADEKCYNHSISFADAEAVERFIAENGYRKVFERERKRKGGVKRYYLCSAFWDWSIKCDHKFTLIAADGVFVGKTTDGGRPHDHRPTYDGCSNDPAPAAAKMKPESSVDVSEESEQQLQNLIRECSSSVIERMRCIYERKKRETEREAMRLFSQMPLDRQKEFIEMQEKQHQRKLRPRRRFADFVRARMPQGITDELLQQTHLSALGIGCDDSDDSFHYDSPIEEKPQEENEEDSLRSLNDSAVTSSNHRRDISTILENEKYEEPQSNEDEDSPLENRSPIFPINDNEKEWK